MLPALLRPKSYALRCLLPKFTPPLCLGYGYRRVTSDPQLPASEAAAEPAKKRLDVAIVGLPNAGKSQLLNILTESTVSAVSTKRHTTRSGVMGARTVGNTQIVFVDTPGFLKVDLAKQEGLDRELVVSAAEEIAEVDLTLLVIDAARNLNQGYKDTLITLMLTALQAQGRFEMIEDGDAFGEAEDWDGGEDTKNEEEENFSAVTTTTNDSTSSSSLPEGPKFAIVLNKVDLVKPKTKLLELGHELLNMAEQKIKESQIVDASEWDFEKFMPPVFFTDARRNEGVDDVLEFLLSRATPSQEWPMQPGHSTDMTAEERIEEIIREKIYRCLHKEVPYNVRQSNKLLKVRRDRQGQDTVIIQQDIRVQTKSHQELVTGSLRRIRETAVRDLEKLFKCPVQLLLEVKLVRSRNFDWSI